MSLKTDFKNEILPEGMEYRTYNVIGEDGQTIHENVHLEKAYLPRQVGDDFGAQQVNEITLAVNTVDETSKTNSQDISALKTGKAPAYTYGTEDLQAGTSPLETGKLYFVYE